MVTASAAPSVQADPRLRIKTLIADPRTRERTDKETTMKLVNLLGVVALGGLLAVGCSSTDTTTTAAGKDTAVPPADTPAETAPDTGPTCEACTADKCKSTLDACTADTTCKPGLDCFAACPKPDPDNTCANKCISDHP